MKLTKKYLRELIKEEINTMLDEIHLPHGAYPTHEEWGETAGVFPGSPGGQFTADERNPQIAAGPTIDALKAEIAGMDKHWLVEEYSRNCTGVDGGDIWCELALDQIKKLNLTPNYD